MGSNNGSSEKPGKKPRRPKGTGGIRNRGTARHPRYFAYYRVSVSGQRKEISEGPFTRKADAEDWLSDELRRLREGRPTQPSQITVGELLDQWLAIRKPGLEPSTFGEYERMVDHRLKPYLGRYKVRELIPTHVDAMFAALRKPGANRRSKEPRALSETTLQHTHTTLRTALEYARRQRIVAHNVMDDVERPRREDTDIRVWTAEQLAQFLRTAATNRLFTLYRLASYSGARRSELLGLQWHNLDLDARTVTIIRRRTRVGYKMVKRSGTKTKASRRTIDIDQATTDALKAWKATQQADRTAWREAYNDSRFVFTAEDGEAVHADHVDYWFGQLVEKAGVPTIRFHDLRHTHATLLLKAGVPVHVVTQRLGHSSPAFTLSIYSHVLPRQQAAAAAAFADLVDGPKGSEPRNGEGDETPEGDGEDAA